MRRTYGTRGFTAVVLTLGGFALAGCGLPIAELKRIAGRGGIDQGAPVIAKVQIEIAAPPSKVWGLLVNASAWPQWDQDITRVSVTQPLALGTRFVWSEGSSTIHSQVELFEPERRLGWTGTAYTAKAVHQWELVPMAGGHTLVRMSESMDGPLMAKLFSSQELVEAGNAWLAHLKKAAEGLA